AAALGRPPGARLPDRLDTVQVVIQVDGGVLWQLAGPRFLGPAQAGKGHSVASGAALWCCRQDEGTTVGAHARRQDRQPEAGRCQLLLDGRIARTQRLEAVASSDVLAVFDRRLFREPLQQRRIERPVKGDAHLAWASRPDENWLRMLTVAIGDFVELPLATRPAAPVGRPTVDRYHQLALRRDA